MIAWKLTTNFDRQRHLFFEKIETGYVIETYSCTCGHIDFVIKHPEQKLNYICKNCKNTNFYDANNAWRNIDFFLHQNLDLNLSYEYDIQSDDNTISSLYVVCIPIDIDFLSHKIIYGKKPVYSLILTVNGELQKNYSLKFEQEILVELEKKLIKYIDKKSSFSIPNSREKILTITMASFFLKNKHLKEFDFYYWVDIDKLQNKELYLNDALALVSNYPKTKLIKKAVYQNYINQISNYESFDFTFMEVFCKTIKNINILESFLTLNLACVTDSNLDQEGLYKIILFLKKHYSEKQLLRLFSSEEFTTNKYLFRDAISEFMYNIQVVTDRFRKVPCKVELLHDEFVRCSKEKRYEYMQNIHLFYSKKNLNACIELNTYQVKLPKTGKELYDWAETLHNCIAGYFNKIKSKKKIIYGFFQDDILKFAVEISDNELIQFSGKYNTGLTIKERETLEKWFKLFYQKDKQKEENVA